jgi:hypothetical protein
MLDVLNPRHRRPAPDTRSSTPEPERHVIDSSAGSPATATAGNDRYRLEPSPSPLDHSRPTACSHTRRSSRATRRPVPGLPAHPRPRRPDPRRSRRPGPAHRHRTRLHHRHRAARSRPPRTPRRRDRHPRPRPHRPPGRRPARPLSRVSRAIEFCPGRDRRSGQPGDLRRCGGVASTWASVQQSPGEAPPRTAEAGGRAASAPRHQSGRPSPGTRGLCDWPPPAAPRSGHRNGPVVPLQSG